MRTNPIRFTGMASGMDTDSIVRDMMRPHQYKIDQEKKAQALIQLRQDAWEDMNKKLSDFHRNFTEKMSRSSTYNKTHANSSNENIISIEDNVVIPPGTHSFTVENLAKAPTIGMKELDGELKSTTTVADLTEKDKDQLLKLKVNDKDMEITLKGTDNLSVIARKMNDAFAKENSGFTARFDAVNERFFISSSKTGAEQSFEFSSDDPGSKLLDGLGFVAGTYKGKNSEYSYNGVSGFESATNNIEVNGVKVTLKAETAEEVTVSSANNPDATYDFVKDFVTEYNKLIDELHEKLDTKPGKDIMPLTSEEREAMSDSDIKLWEDKLNSSLFYQDTDLANFVDSARRTLGQVLGGDEFGQYNSLSSLGIVTGSWQEKGKLYIMGDEDLGGMHSAKTNKLKEALQKDPDQVNKLFQKVGKDLYDTHEKAFRSGNRLKSAMKFYNDKVMVDKVKSYEERISVLEERMYQMEDRQYAKFAAMEKMLSALHSQGDWLMQQFGGMM